MPPRIALVTYSGLSSLSADDRLVLGPLARRGIDAEAAAWDDPAVRWEAYAALVVRSTWNYHLCLGAFGAWIDRVGALGVPVWNPPSILRWNADKRYLQGLATAGVDVVPTRWVEGERESRGSRSELRETLVETQWPEAVVKPAVSASAYETFRVTPADVTAEVEARFRRLAGRPGGVMVQRFVPELTREGEWSVIFLGGEYSHAVLKRPRTGDFRVQQEHGGAAEARTPPAYLLEAAERVLACVEHPMLYARVDGCEVGGRFVLLELELLEPSLFLAAEPKAAERFAEAIRGVLSG